MSCPRARGTAAGAPDEAVPRYVTVANALTEAIGTGRYPVGAALPTEHELCERFSVSRFTVREALRRLAQGGLVSRRPRAGTVVTARARRDPYVQTIESIDGLMQYTVDTRMRIVQTGSVTHAVGAAADLPFPAGETWGFALGVRHRSGDGLPICVTRVYLNPGFKGIVRRVAGQKGPIYRVIERHYGVPVARVDQRISATSLSREDAQRLKARAGEPALRLRREYYDGAGRLLEVADSVHPAGRFSYQMTLRKPQPGDTRAAPRV
jgi:DNA-binding GntR family transcriptional regulator